MANSSLSTVQHIMAEFAHDTGLTEKMPPRRYLWTDAFAVCNYLELYRLTENGEYLELAERLVDQVHKVLGRHRADDDREGWISGLSEEQGLKRPTAGGLRIGKEMPERGEDDPYDSRLEWERDGQYFHYLTKWMHALNRVARVAGNPTYLRWAGELAEIACVCFCYRPEAAGPGGMYWKMSIDLSRPLVRGMGQHDPLDGYITCRELQHAAGRFAGDFPDLVLETDKFESLVQPHHLTTDDPLGLGGLMTDALRLAILHLEGDVRRFDLLTTMVTATYSGLMSYIENNMLRLPVDYRLAFRELGLAIGLHGFEGLESLIIENSEGFKDSISSLLSEFAIHLPLAERIENFWLDPENSESRSYMAHKDINMVMLATSLAPGSYLEI